MGEQRSVKPYHYGQLVRFQLNALGSFKNYVQITASYVGSNPTRLDNQGTLVIIIDVAYW
jgi:hypothetical protein